MSANDDSQPKLCIGCQMFFGNPASNNMCSSCFKTYSANNAPTKTLPRSSTAENLAANPVEPVASGSEEPSDVPSSSTSRPIQTNKNKCFVCKKKVGLHGFECKCEYVFCPVHRYADQHNCDFDYKSVGRAAIEAHNPVVKGERVSEI